MLASVFGRTAWNRSRSAEVLSWAATFLDMDHSRLGRTGLQVSKLCLGTMTFGLQCDEPTSVSILDRAAEGGIDFIDSSDVYPLGGDLATVGRTEEILGRWLHGKRDRFVLATKCFGRTGPSPFDSGKLQKAYLRRNRRILAPTTNRLHRSLSAPRVRFGDPDRRDARCARRSCPPRKDPLHRMFELSHLPAGPRHRAQRDARAGAIRLGSTSLQPVVPPDRA